MRPPRITSEKVMLVTLQELLAISLYDQQSRHDKTYSPWQQLSSSDRKYYRRIAADGITSLVMRDDA